MGGNFAPDVPRINPVLRHCRLDTIPVHLNAETVVTNGLIEANVRLVLHMGKSVQTDLSRII